MERTIISFNYAIKDILRNKANFDILIMETKYGNDVTETVTSTYSNTATDPLWLIGLPLTVEKKTISTIFLFFTDAGYKIQKLISPVAVKDSFQPFGSNQAGGSIDASIGIPQVTPISYRVHGGTSYYWKYEDLMGNDLSGWETRWGAEAGIQSYMLHGLPPGLYTFSGTNFDSK